MSRTGVERALIELAERNPDTGELVTIHEDLLAVNGDHVVASYALAEVVGDLLVYLDFVASELEKSVGVKACDERTRILEEFSLPSGETTRECVHDIIHQWDDIDRLSRDDILAMRDTETRLR